jgi:hypothetical protein
MLHRLCKAYARMPYSIGCGEILLGIIGGGVASILLTASFVKGSIISRVHQPQEHVADVKPPDRVCFLVIQSASPPAPTPSHCCTCSIRLFALHASGLSLRAKPHQNDDSSTLFCSHRGCKLLSQQTSLRKNSSLIRIDICEQ